MNGIDALAIFGFITCALWLAAWLDNYDEPPLQSIEEAKERVHYFPDEEPYDWEEEEDDGD